MCGSLFPVNLSHDLMLEWRNAWFQISTKTRSTWSNTNWRTEQNVNMAPEGPPLDGPLHTELTHNETKSKAWIKTCVWQTTVHFLHVHDETEQVHYSLKHTAQPEGKPPFSLWTQMMEPGVSGCLSGCLSGGEKQRFASGWQHLTHIVESFTSTQQLISCSSLFTGRSGAHALSLRDWSSLLLEEISMSMESLPTMRRSRFAGGSGMKSSSNSLWK